MVERAKLLLRWLLPLALIGWGAWLIWPPGAPLAVGALCWAETRFGK